MKKAEYIDQEEKDLLESFSSVDRTSIRKPSKKEQSILKKAAKDYLSSQTKMNIRIDRTELEIIKKRAALDGLKYQTYVKSIIHKYVTGQLVEKKSR